MAKKHHSSSKIYKLRQQLEGKQVVVKPPTASTVITPLGSFALPTNIDYTPIAKPNLNQDILYLRKDMTKIAFLASLAIAAQLILFICQRNGLLFRGL